MKKYWFLFLLAFPFFGQAKCTYTNNLEATQAINLDFTKGNEITVNFNPNLKDGDYVCDALTDKMYFSTSLQDYIIEMKDKPGGESVYIKLTLEADGFPVDTPRDIVSPKTYSVSNTINNKEMKLTASYIPPTSYDEAGSKGELVIATGDSFQLKNAAAIFTSNNVCSSGPLASLLCYLFGLSSLNESYKQKLIFNIKHKPTTCSFSQSIYEIQMPDIAISEVESANDTKTGSTNLLLNCDSVNKVTTNPVTFKVARGEWDDSGTILKNTSLNGAKGVGFQIYNGNATTPLKLGDTLMNKLTKMAAIENQYTFPITAKYVRVKEEAIQPGEVQSKAIFAVSYD